MNRELTKPGPTASNVPLRHSGTWMVALDDRILEVLSTEDSLKPHLIALDIDYALSEQRVVKRLRVLSQAGYVRFSEDHAQKCPDDREYGLTIWGELYLDGEVRADLIDPEPSPARPGYVLR